ncbi:MAG TPA: CocE/NonD family hydrolase [Burkholderiales bacterium]|nr:CocE/NonD family hydrolase [Burkholderiales bacterium]
MKIRSAAVLLVLFACAAAGGRAQERPLNSALNESVVMIRHGFGVELETTIFKPDGAGPFPLAVINHGKSLGNPRFQARSRFIVAARELVRRGYVVAIPMRAGFSNSSGLYIEGGCNIAGNARHQATYVRTALDYMTKQPYVDRTRIVVMGQSHGGLTSMAFATEPYEGVRGVFNFAGGLRLTGSNCFDWQDNLVRAFRELGSSARFPTIWFYGDNDSYFEIDLVKRMHAAYTAAGGKAQLVAYGPFKTDAHSLFGDRDGLPLWLPEAERFLQAVGMPTAVLPRTAPEDPALAALSDVSRIPHVNESCVKGYALFLDYDYPRAYAISPDGRCGYAYGGEDPKKRAVNNCQRRSREPCRLYAVDDSIVWQ